MSRIVVSADAPHAILAVGAKIMRLLGYSPRQLHGCVLQTLQGPETDTVLLRWAIKSACENSNSVCCQVVLYDSKGRSQNIIVRCSRYVEASRVGIGCMLTLKNSPAFALADIYLCTNNHIPWVIASAVWPFSIYTVSDAFYTIFGHKESDLESMTLVSLTAHSCHPSCWQPLTKSAGTGSITTGAACIRHHSGVDPWLTFTCSPVVEWPNSTIAYVAIVFDRAFSPTPMHLD
jgi:hypothetical protein